jgi:hypothetical protein
MAPPTIITNVTAPRVLQREQVLTNAKHEEEDYRVACYPKSDLLAAAIITCSGEFLLTYLNADGSIIWAAPYHVERLDLNIDQDAWFCSVGFAEKRAVALDRRGNLLAMDLILLEREVPRDLLDLESLLDRDSMTSRLK